MSRIYATKDVLASVIVLDKSMEEFPEPYRSSKDNEIIVSFDVYKNFIKDYLSITDYLATDTAKLKSFLARNCEEELCKCFYRDMALAIAKELWYTSNDKVPTRLTHFISSDSAMPEEYVSIISQSFAAQLARAASDLKDYMRDADYTLPAWKTVKFGTEFSYATILFAMSSMNNEYGVPFCKWSLERRL